MSKQFLATLGAVLTVVWPLVRAYIQTKVTPQRLDTVLNLARTVVAAAEQVGNDLDIHGSDKLFYAKTALTSAAKRVGVKLSEPEADAFIHAVLRELNSLAELDVPEVVPSPVPEAA